MKIIEQRFIESPLDILELNIIDFNRLNGVWGNPREAIDTIFSWFDPMLTPGAVFTICNIDDFERAPDRDDFPDWKHIGSHVEIAKYFWNWFFFNHPNGHLRLSDSPDFWGNFGEFFPTMRGDFGKVSASTFALSQKAMQKNDIWVSVLGNGSEHVIIESQYSILDFYDRHIEV